MRADRNLAPWALHVRFRVDDHSPSCLAARLVGFRTTFLGRRKMSARRQHRTLDLMLEAASYKVQFEDSSRPTGIDQLRSSQNAPPQFEKAKSR